MIFIQQPTVDIRLEIVGGNNARVSKTTMSLLDCRIALQWRIWDLFELGECFNNRLVKAPLICL